MVVISLKKLIFSQSLSSHWFGAVEQAVHVLFRLHPRPDIMATDLVRSFAEIVQASISRMHLLFIIEYFRIWKLDSAVVEVLFSYWTNWFKNVGSS